MMVRTSLVRPAAFTPTTFVTTMKAMNPALSRMMPRASMPGTKELKYCAKATGKTASENHSASSNAQPTMNPANGVDTAFT
jgi:hypothetical protein